ncbi:MAG TPA: SRPBCC domain-containing protein [Bacteroidetes bacterium]|nr:SRPBCC domain-containing protein [Bacteroidota bacterium]
MQAITVSDVDLFIPRGFQLKKALPAPREKAFEAWTQPEAIKQWFRPGPGYEVPFAVVNLRHGSRFKIGLKDPDGKLHLFAGVFTEVRVPEKLVYTWSFGGGGTHQERSLVAVKFEQKDGQTELTLSHGLFLNESLKNEQQKMWEGILESFANYLRSSMGRG